MKRSEINQLITEGVVLFRKMGISLPPQAHWNLETWYEHRNLAEEMRKRSIGWDLTDFGSGDFSKIGMFNYTVSNGFIDLTTSKPADQPYSNKVKIVKEGQAYPTYYAGFPTDLRNKLTSLTNQARNNGLGMWQVDINANSVRIRNESDLEQLAMWPKLYRRLSSYFTGGNTRLALFETWLRNEPEKDDELWIISRGEFGNIHDIFKITGNKLKMTVSAEDIVIVPR